MVRVFKHIFSLLLLLVFLLPSVIRFDHHHDDERSCDAQSEAAIHAFHKKCGVCNFEFSLFTSGIETPDLQKNIPPDTYTNTYTSQYLNKLSRFSFSLRAPPLRLV